MQRYVIGLKDFKGLRQQLKLSSTQKAILIGSILGDGYLQLSKTKTNARLQIRNTNKYVAYVDWKYKFFCDWSPNGLVKDSANNSTYFLTIFHPELLYWKKTFYSNGRKIIPINISALLTHPLSLAVWLMDDGNGYLRSKALRISSYCFLKEEHRLLQDCLMKNFEIDSKLCQDSKGFQLYIPVRSSEKLFNLVRDYIHPSMLYKFARLNPVETTR